MNNFSFLNFNHLKALKNPLVSRETSEFVLKEPFYRLTILAFLLFASKLIGKNKNIIDVGAGEAPYKELFVGNKYYTSDFSQNIYHTKNKNDFICPADKIPVKPNFFDAIICTEVLEHVPNPDQVFNEFHRILKRKGQLFITTPFIIQPHEVPYDYFRYTPYFYNEVFKKNNFKIKFIIPRGGSFTTTFNIILSVIYFNYFNKKRSDKQKVKHNLLINNIYKSFIKASIIVLNFLDMVFDKKQIFPIGYSVYATKN